jgi:ADP-ribosylglycohydrolase/protein-tyrosine phosphatase
MTAKTSDSDPIRVDFLPQHLLGTSGRIGMTFAPGKKDHGMYALWNRDLGADLGHLVDVYGAAVLVSLVEDAELDLLSIRDLPAQADAAGLELLRFPFRDAGVPASVEAGAAIVGAVLDAAVSGRNVVIHCRGGLGRTGLVAACCLVALGCDATDGISHVRAARAGAVETRGQEQFIHSFAKEHRGTRRPGEIEANRPPLARFRGCLLGGAIGDALGYPIEFEKSAIAILSKHGNTAPADLIGRRGGLALVSDDTQMTLFVAEGVIRGIQRGRDRGIVSMPGSVQRSLVRWYATQTGIPLGPVWGEWPGWLVRDRRLHVRRAPGNTCMSSLAAQLELRAEPGVDEPPNDSKGCGAVMRSAPIGLAAGSRELAFDLGRSAGALTHGHPSGYLSAAYFASIIHDVSRGVELADAMDLAGPALVASPGHEEMITIVRAVHAAAKGGPPSPQEIERIGGGWTGEEALGIALLCALTADVGSPEGIAEALWRSVAHGGDSDSTGSITGNLLGAMVGVERLPARWLEQVELRDVVERIADDLHAVAILGTQLDFEAYPPC